MKTRSQRRQEIAANGGPTGFLTLSAELRNTIYMLVLADRDPEIEVTDRRPLRLTTDQPVTVQLLRTCRTVHEEATPIFYGSTNFTFARHLSFREFCTTVGRNVQFVRKIVMLDPMFYHMERESEHFGNAILDMPKLESLRLPRRGWPEQDAERFVVAFRRLYKIKGMKDRGRGIAAMIVFIRVEMVDSPDGLIYNQIEDIAHTESVRKWILENF